MVPVISTHTPIHTQTHTHTDTGQIKDVSRIRLGNCPRNSRVIILRIGFQISLKSNQTDIYGKPRKLRKSHKNRKNDAVQK